MRSRMVYFLLAVLFLFLPQCSFSQRVDTASSAPLPHPHWLKNGLIDAGGSHEPFLFVVRRGGQRLDAYQEYQAAQSEGLLQRLKEQGVEVFHTHLYKGFGMQAEKPDMEETRKTTEIAHRLGLKVDTYIQWNTMMYETFFAEEPRAQNWIQRDAAGKPILLTYGYQQSYRYRPCFANQEYLDYLKKIVKYAVEEVKTDFIHFDNFDLNPEPDSCHCGVCVAGFRNFLKSKYSAEKRKERFGFANVDYVNPPQWNDPNPPQKMEIIFDPAIQEWIDFRCQIMSDALKLLALYTRSLNPEVAIEVNPHGITGGNRAWEAGLDHSRFLKYTDVFWTEEENEPGYLPDGRLISRIRSLKLARTYGNVLLSYIADNPVAMAENLSFNQTLGFVGQDPLSPDMVKYIDFYRKNRELYQDSRDVATVAVFRSHPSIAYHNARAQLSAILVEQALIQARIPFDLIFDEHLASLSKYSAVILPDSECLSDGQIASLRTFVQNGGGLVVTEQSGLYDEWRRLRVQPGLAGLVESQPKAEAYQERVSGSRPVSAPPAKKEFGRGRVVYLPSLVFDGPMPEAEAYFTISNRYWKRPANWQELCDAVHWAANGHLPLEVKGPPSLVANLVSQPSERRMSLHLVNYAARQGNTAAAVEVKVELPTGASIKRIKLLSPDQAETTISKSRQEGALVSFMVPEIKTYGVAVMSW
jgi:hypothetical protein